MWLGRDRRIELRFTESWNSQPEEPCMKTIKSGGCGVEFVKNFGKLPNRDVLRLNGVGRTLAGRWCVTKVRGRLRRSDHCAIQL
jgi:hypothetical protein